METKQEDSFLVDVGKTMVDTNRISSEGKDNQRLFCKCGATKQLTHKARRLLVKKHDTTVEDKHSIEEFSCDKCKTVYNKNNRVFLLVPDEDELYKVHFRCEDSKDFLTLFRDKVFAKFDSPSGVLHHSIVRTDIIKFNKKTKESNIFLSKPSLDKTMAQQKQSDASDIKEEIGLGKISKLEHFFQYHDFAMYFGLIEIYNFFSQLSPYVADVEKIKVLNPKIKFCFKNFEIIEKDVDGQNTPFLYEESGYGDGKKELRRLNLGGYLSRYLDVSQVFLCVTDLPYITTVLLTKGEKFFVDFLHSKNILHSKVFKKLDATSPIKIVEVALNYDNNGQLRELDKTTLKTPIAKDKIEESDSYLKLSPLIYKNITAPTDMDILLSVYRKKLISKSDMEVLFTGYEPNRVYKFFRNLEKQRSVDSKKFTLRHVKHILDYSIDDVQKGQNGDYLHLYLDTMNTMDLLELPVNYIFKNIKNNIELKTVHDDLASRYNAIKDQKKAQFYQKAIQELGAINTVIDDIAFTVVPTLEELNKEGMNMGHCVYTYLDKVVNKSYVAVHVQHTISNERATLGLVRNGNSLGFDQLKGYQNSRATREMIEATVEFLKKNDIKTNGGSSSDLSANTGYTKRMHDYLSDAEVAEIRRKRAEKEKTEKAKRDKAQKEGIEYAPEEQEKTVNKKRKKGILGNFFGDSE
jgi:hypothetical protein